ncbi:hypothetical protein PoB_007042600 [Plakobranchus ocellatus]|uniref:Uncharacterized protein n=1 Tax=Plakobranchus ocellatus TaxID=259542 RepID=A0AAV4DJ89_9GAST|nr:hypothetical protein PoB_007042600 [Plakobranchus ocellatus]
MQGLRSLVAAIGILCAVLFLLTANSEARLFKVRDKDKEVCGMMAVNYTITITARHGQSILGNISFTQDSSENYGMGDCRNYLSIHMHKTVELKFRIIFSEYPMLNYMLHRTVSFVPSSIFGEKAPSTKIVVFENPKDTVIGPPDHSYKCLMDEKLLYNRANAISSSLMYSSEGRSEDITYTVLVDVKGVQVQVSDVHKEQFGLPEECMP